MFPHRFGHCLADRPVVPTGHDSDGPDQVVVALPGAPRGGAARVVAAVGRSAWERRGREELQREHPAVPFAGAGVIPDFSLQRGHLRIEGKYIRQGTTPSRVTEGMAADLIKYPQEAHILFVVYDYHHAIGDRERLKRDFEGRGRCTVCVLP